MLKKGAAPRDMELLPPGSSSACKVVGIVASGARVGSGSWHVDGMEAALRLGPEEDLVVHWVCAGASTRRI